MSLVWYISRFKQYPNGTLVLHSVELDDEGPYKCVGISESGPVQAFVSELQLACKYRHFMFLFGSDEKGRSI